ncbi:uncharacterized protein LOC144727669 [Lampetra planeri]
MRLNCFSSSPVIDGKGLQLVEENDLGLRQLSMRGAVETSALADVRKPPLMTSCGTGRGIFHEQSDSGVDCEFRFGETKRKWPHSVELPRKKNWQSGRFENDSSSPRQTHPPSLARPAP